MSDAPKKLVLIDSHAIIHRAFHAIRPLTTSGGELVNAVFGFTSILLNVIEIERPDYLAATFDMKGPTFRHEADDTYKATRTKAPDELVGQFARVHEIVDAMNIPAFGVAGFEADDMIATIATRMANESDVQTIIVSGDRDLLQLVTDRVSMHDLTGGYRESINFTPDAVRAKYGFGPERIPDYKGLAGDTSDNIAGVAGIGPKTATDLIRAYGDLDGIYAHLTELSPTVRAKLEANRDAAYHCRQMATLHRDAPIDFDIAACHLQTCDRATVVRLLDELDFKSLIRRFEKLFPSSTMTTGDAPIQPSLF